MDDSEKRSLQCYITNVLSPVLEHAEAEAARWSEVAKSATGFDLDLAVKMRSYHKGKAEAYTYAVVEFKELFSEELSEVDHE